VIVLATDGIPTDAGGRGGAKQTERFIEKLKEMNRLPIWMVIRLCSDDRKVIDYYNAIDEKMELRLEVLDDFPREAKEIHNYNKWLNYTLPLHRCREMGFKHRMFDLIDERKLMLSELRDFCMFLFSSDDIDYDDIPDPDVNLPLFVSALSDGYLNEKNVSQWNVVTKKRSRLVDPRAVEKYYRRAQFIAFLTRPFRRRYNRDLTLQSEKISHGSSKIENTPEVVAHVVSETKDRKNFFTYQSGPMKTENPAEAILAE